MTTITLDSVDYKIDLIPWLNVDQATCFYFMVINNRDEMSDEVIDRNTFRKDIVG